ncbi:multidrug efflux transporter AcrB transmembrane domain-containing protein [Auriculariales sp. MPI-PUGE-AT-0066]|nr:multidrug efflux transporter AcrB transmembrane domain-containing protein [Auriculariales sp. MPI-PUGE-AT-0066]
MADNEQRCAMRGLCGTDPDGGIFSPELPCPYSGPPIRPEDDKDEDNTVRHTLVQLCGQRYADIPLCCSGAQVETLSANLQRASLMIASCPACIGNFKDFFCDFTCSPSQGSFVNVTSTLLSTDDKQIVASIDYFVSEEFRTGFFDSCKGVQFAATNGFVMDLLGGGAQSANEFLAFLGKKQNMGSPFPISFPSQAAGNLSIYQPEPRSCADTSNLANLCSCVDCPAVCPALPPPPSHGRCHVGTLSCLSFVLILGYSLGAAAFISGFLLQRNLRRRRERAYERVALSVDTHTTSPASQHRALVGASSLANYPTEDSQDTTNRASLIDPLDATQPRQNKLNTLLRRIFYRLGLFCASHPWIVFALVFALIGLLNIGWKWFDVERDPVRLWVAPDSESRIQKEIFDQEFGPFFRAQQLFITANLAEGETEPGPVLSYERLRWLARVEEDIEKLKSSPNNITLADVCFRPGGPRGACVVQSVTAWWSNPDNIGRKDWADHIRVCAARPGDCLPKFQQPLSPQYVLGGRAESGDWLESKALVVNYVVDNSLDTAKVARAEEWERTLRSYLTTASERAPREADIRLTFQTGVSLEEELNKSTNTDIPIVVLSYVVMFLYIALTLGDSSSAGPDDDNFAQSISRWVVNFPRLFKKRQSIALTDDPDLEHPPTWLPRLPRRIFVGSKFTLGLFGIGLVILSVSAATGFCSMLGIKSTLIIAEVIPFLVLAVGVDNIFILVHEVDRQGQMHGPYAATIGSGEAFSNLMSPTQTRDSDADSAPQQLPVEERVARAVARMGPSVLLSSLTETLAFGLGALVPMPAVRNFALYAAGSVFINALLQITVFISALAIDVRRTEAGRVDCFPCIRLPAKIALTDGTPGLHAGRLARFIRRHYAPFLLRQPVKIAVLLLFGGSFVLSVISMQHIKLGLDERLALPRDSYLIEYFNDLHEYLEIGPPPTPICGRFSTCDPYSLANVLEGERKRPSSSYIGTPTSSWIDDFFLWLNPEYDECCLVKKNDPSQFCDPRRAFNCVPCLQGRTPAWNITMDGLPDGEVFGRYLRQWLQSPTTEDCPVAGQASYGSALSLNDPGEEKPVKASHFRTFTTPLRTQDDFINAFAAAHRVAEEISSSTNLDVFPYSYFFVFFDQYAHIIGLAQEVLGLGLASVLFVTSLLLGSWRTGTIVTGVVALTVTSVMGVMGVWGIMLNAISVVNLVIALGIAVEFCAHIARAFMGAATGTGSLPVDHPSGQRERDERMWVAMVDVGPSVLSGITFTKLIGLSVLALTRSKLLEIYHFRMWMTLIISGALHGLVLLPVVLSLAGGAGYTVEDADEEWMATALRRRDHEYEYRPFMADTESVSSD